MFFDLDRERIQRRGGAEDEVEVKVRLDGFEGGRGAEDGFEVRNECLKMVCSGFSGIWM